MKRCSQCAKPTPHVIGVCDACIAAATARERAEQGLSPKVTDNPATAAWLARLLLPVERKAS